MGKSVNKVIILGNVGKDPEIRATGGGTMVANISIATSERSKDSSGNWSEKTEWHSLVAFGRTAEVIRDYVQKGSKIYIEGALQTQSWEDRNSGEMRYRTVIIVRDLVLLSSSGERQNSATNKPAQREARQYQAPDEDSIPF